MQRLKSALVAAIVSCGLAATADAMPANHLSDKASLSVQKTAWVCGPYRCWWRPAWPYWGYRMTYGGNAYAPYYRGAGTEAGIRRPFWGYGWW